MEIIDILDSVADRLEAKGLVKLAYKIDKVSNNIFEDKTHKK